MKKMKLVLAVAAVAAMATVGVANAQIGVGTKWIGNGVEPALVLPIMMNQLVIEPYVNLKSTSNSGTDTRVRFGASIEKTIREGTSPLFGVEGALDINSPEVGDSYTNVHFGVFLGGTASLADNVSIVGRWGPRISIFAKESPINSDATVIETAANITLRWWVFGT